MRDSILVSLLVGGICFCIGAVAVLGALAADRPTLLLLPLIIAAAGFIVSMVIERLPRE